MTVAQLRRKKSAIMDFHGNATDVARAAAPTGFDAGGYRIPIDARLGEEIMTVFDAIKTVGVTPT